jgi:hypothetical protein
MIDERFPSHRVKRLMPVGLLKSGRIKYTPVDLDKPAHIRSMPDLTALGKRSIWPLNLPVRRRV